MPKKCLCIVVVHVVLLFAANAIAQDRLVVAGTGDSQTLMRNLAGAFEQANPGSRVDVPDSVGSSGGIRALIKGQCDLARVARPLNEGEKQKAADLVHLVFAKSPVVIAANLPDKCATSLTSTQIGGIFSGKIKDWSAVDGCQAHSIYVANREDGDSARAALLVIPEFKAITQFAGETIYSTAETLQTLEETPFAIGYLDISTISSALVAFDFNGFSASEVNVQNGSYPLNSSFGLVWRGKLLGLAASFVDFVFSPKAQEIIRSTGAIPIVRKGFNQ